MASVERLVSSVRADVATLPLPLRVALSGALVLGVLGSACGLVLGLIAHPSTAWFAVLEVGAPAALVGGVGGLVVGGGLWLTRAVSAKI